MTVLTRFRRLSVAILLFACAWPGCRTVHFVERVVTAWASEKYKRFNPELRVKTYMRVGRSYVVLDKLTLPNGLFGAHSRAFIIPDDVPFPTGPRCHNTFYKMNGTATGPGAREE